MIFGYSRNSTHKQDLQKQREQLTNAGCEKIFEEVMSGGILNRPILNSMLEQLRLGDVIVVCDYSRISRGGIKDMFSLIETIEKKGANIKSLKESWIDTINPQGKFLFTVIAGVNELEKNLVSQRTKESLMVARSRGRIGGRPKKDSKKIEMAVKMYESKVHSIKEITNATGVSKTTLYRYMNNKIRDLNNNKYKS
ncbi:recombinase family protein [Clostridium gasigenes]|uniref:Site-specific DNA recombinase n=1 Tax=Clostridium gasigenes TaxID=94869 RepID=A0A1H0S340_9CLOT|nr:recombinase family protein [Clostridium gasigenes]SDP35668.1 Site-specific DNA recombinase [Clostridium gasigenes]